MGRILSRPLWTSVATFSLLALAACDLLVSDEARIQRATALRTQGDYRAATIELKKVLQKHPDNRDARLLLGEISLLTGEVAAAEKELRRARDLGVPKDRVVVSLGRALLIQGQFNRVLEEVEPDGIENGETREAALMLRGEAYLSMARLDEAEQAFRQALSSATDSPDARIGLAWVEQRKGNPEAAETHIAEILSRDPGHVRAWLTRGQFALIRGRYAQAEESFGAALKPAPVPIVEEVIGRNGLVESQWRQGKSDAALQNVERLLELQLQHPRPKYFRALIAYGAGDYKTAKEYLQQVLREFPDYRPATLLLGATHYAQGELEQADMHLSSVLATEPTSLSARKLLAATRLRQHKPEDALAALSPALARDGDDSQLLALMGKASLQAGDAEAGIQYLKRGAGTDPSNHALQVQLATGYMSTGDTGDAIKLLEQMPQTQDGAYGRELLLILAYLRKGDNESAIGQALKLVASRPNDPGAHNLAGSVYMAALQLQRAREQFEKALLIQPDNLAVLMNLGRLEFQEGNQDGARSRFERVAALSPQNVGAMAALAQLAALRDDQATAVQWLQRATEANPQAVEPKLLMIRYCLETGDLSRARDVATDFVEAAPTDGNAQNALGIVQMAEQKYEEAASSFAKSVAAVPTSPNFSYNLARAELARNNTGEAKKALAKTLELQPGNLAATATLAAIEMREGNSGQALGRARVLQQDSKTASAGHLLEGDLHMMRREFEAAARAYDSTSKQAPSGLLAIKLYQARSQAQIPEAAKPLEQWLSKHPDDIPVRLALAQSYQEHGQHNQAAVEYQRILKSHPDDAVTLNNLAWTYHEAKDPRALATAERAHMQQPDNGAITDTFGWLLVQEGQAQRGVELLRKATQQAPNVPDIQYHLAVALVNSGAKEEARRTLVDLVNSGQTFQDLGKAKVLLEQL